MTTGPAVQLLEHIPHVVSLGGVDGGPPVQTPHRESVFCTVLFADLSGFTACADALARSEQRPDAIGHVLNAHLRPLVDICESHGGDVVKFAGDALLVCWPTTEDGLDVRTTILAASSCGLAMQDAIAEISQATPGQALQLRVGVAAGPVRILHLGTSSTRRVLLMSGDGIDRATLSGAQSEPGEVSIGRLASQLVGEELQVRLVGSKTVVEAVVPLDAFELPTLPERSWHPDFGAYLTAAVLENPAFQNRRWVTETRVVTAMFIHLAEVTVGSDPVHLDELVRTTHAAIRSHGGVTNKVSVDEKGATLLAVFGLPPRVHEDDASRACRAALAIHGALHRAGEVVSIGLATGRAFCGEIGGEHRREYTVIGDTVNTAARLMIAGRGMVSTDRQTESQAREVMEFETLPSVQLKGKSKPIQRYRPVGMKQRSTTPAFARPIGRDPHLMRVVQAAQHVVQQGRAWTELVVGPAGIGKSALAEAVGLELQRYGVRILRTHADGLHSALPGTPLRSLLAALYGTGPTPGELQQVRTALHEAAGAEAALLGLVEDLLPVPVGAPPSAPGGNHDATRADLLTQLLERGIARTPTAFIVEDVHWLDALSLQVFRRLAARRVPLVLFLTARPPPDASESVWSALHQITRPVAVSPLTRKQTGKLLARRLNVQRLPRELADMVYARSAGNPLFIIHLADHLKATGAVVTAGSSVRIQSNQMVRWQAGLPVTIEALLLSRVDRLQSRAQFTLKVASVFGERFTLEGLQAAHPLHRSREELQADLTELEGQEVVAQTAKKGTWRFRHILIRDAVYEILPSHQRQGLHRAAAQHLLQTTPPPWFDIGAHAHRAGDDTRALEAFSRAALAGARDGDVGACTQVLRVSKEVSFRVGASTRQLARLSWAAAIVAEHHDEPEIARERMDEAIRHLSQLPTSSFDLRAEQAGALLSSGRLYLRDGNPGRASEEFARAAGMVPDAPGLEDHARVLLATSRWQQEGPRAAGRVVPEQQNPSWHRGTLTTLLALARASSEEAIATRLQELAALLAEPQARKAHPEDRDRLCASRLGILLLQGDLDGAQTIASAGTQSEPSLPGMYGRMVAGLMTSVEAEARVQERPGTRLEHAAVALSDALACWNHGDREHVSTQLRAALSWFPDLGHPGPETWPALLVATILAEQVGTDLRAEELDKLDSWLERAGKATPSAAAAFQRLRVRLTRSRGQTSKAWLMDRWPGRSHRTMGWHGADVTLLELGSRRALPDDATRAGASAMAHPDLARPQAQAG